MKIIFIKYQRDIIFLPFKSLFNIINITVVVSYRLFHFLSSTFYVGWAVTVYYRIFSIYRLKIKPAFLQQQMRVIICWMLCQYMHGTKGMFIKNVYQKESYFECYVPVYLEHFANGYHRGTYTSKFRSGSHWNRNYTHGNCKFVRE